MSERAADRQTLVELNSALLLTNERETQSLQLIGWVAHPHSAAVLLEVGLNPKEIYLCSSEARPDVARLLRDENTYVFLCGLKGMEKGVEDAFTALCQANGLDWSSLRPQMLQQGRYHVETY